MTLGTLKDPLYQIAKDAGAAILEIYQDPSLFEVDYKSDASPLTAADRAANDIIIEGLKRLPEGFPIISEESKMIPYEERKHFDYCWLVDPLDGTKEFIKRNGEFTVNIALVKSGDPVAGIIYVPVTGACYFAAQEFGAWRLDKEADKALQCKPFDIKQSGLRVLCSRSHLSSATKEYVDRLNNPSLVPQGSSLKFTVMAEGDGDVYPRIGPTMEWDTAAAHALLNEAGGGIVEFATGKPLTYNKPSLLNPDFVAFGKGSIEI
ncbi:MAG: 3'(2'),5'-bisphosphate nucleotidase CysQ [Saprospiraceae bacterium]|nr:3'(2'),5'-bisphosphate nucleotidase CysQ [Saprospiraceae bacterium]